jgi:hypothetical protein
MEVSTPCASYKICCQGQITQRRMSRVGAQKPPQGRHAAQSRDKRLTATPSQPARYGQKRRLLLLLPKEHPHPGPSRSGAIAQEYGRPSPSTHLKSPVARAIIWNKELDSLTLYKESNHHYRATRSGRGGLVGVLRTPSFPLLFLASSLGMLPGAVRQRPETPHLEKLSLLGKSFQARHLKASVAALLIRHFS